MKYMNGQDYKFDDDTMMAYRDILYATERPSELALKAIKGGVRL